MYVWRHGYGEGGQCGGMHERLCADCMCAVQCIHACNVDDDGSAFRIMFCRVEVKAMCVDQRVLLKRTERNLIGHSCSAAVVC